MLKKLSLIVLALELTVTPIRAGDLQVAAPAGNPVVLTTSTSIRLVPNPSTAAPFMCDSILIQVAPGNSNIVYVLSAPPNVTMTYNTLPTVTVGWLGVPASSTTTGPSMTIPSNGTAASAAGGVDMRMYGLYGSTNDSVYATCSLRN
jgi:hypothetical protein